MTTPVIAALYVQPGGVYYGIPDVEPWGLPERDARLYAGPHPVVAHPPCQRWGRYWSGGPNSAKYPRERRLRGDDGACFAQALWSVRTFGGVLEHPEASSAWRWFGIEAPMRVGGWRKADSLGGWTCCVEQGHYGHRARKATWLYSVGCDLVHMRWGPSESKAKLDDGFHSSAERAASRQRTASALEARLSKAERAATPLPFRDLLLSMARTAAR